MRAASQRGGGLRRAAAALVLGGVVGCFQPDFAASAACDSSEPCAEAGLHGCVLVPDAPGRRGFCTDSCDGDAACPAPPTGDAPPRCAVVGGASLCVLSCMNEETCPEGQVCTEVGGVDGGAARLCFPEAGP